MPNVSDLKIKIFADGADFEGMKKLYANPLIKGFTTNPTLMRKAGITDYESFGRQILSEIPDRPISLEVFADDFDEMEKQARVIAGWGSNVNVKIPVTNTKGAFSGDLIRRLSAEGIALNVTAIFTVEQVTQVAEALDPKTPSVVSVFAGRIADTGVDPEPIMKQALQVLSSQPKAQLLWASPRELLNIYHADRCGTHIITVTHDLLAKLTNVGYGLEAFSLDTVKMFHNDAAASQFSIRC
ncbi:MAG TPA: transaldolase [Terracidiphilus sp.]|nr:transaldolase [Terracidiphilus sp.]